MIDVLPSGAGIVVRRPAIAVAEREYPAWDQTHRCIEMKNNRTKSLMFTPESLMQIELFVSLDGVFPEWSPTVDLRRKGGKSQRVRFRVQGAIWRKFLAETGLSYTSVCQNRTQGDYAINWKSSSSRLLGYGQHGTCNRDAHWGGGP